MHIQRTKVINGWLLDVVACVGMLVSVVAAGQCRVKGPCVGNDNDRVGTFIAEIGLQRHASVHGGHG